MNTVVPAGTTHMVNVIILIPNCNKQFETKHAIPDIFCNNTFMQDY